MFTYICLGTNDLPRAAAFYDAALAPLGLRRCDTSGETEWTGWVGWGRYAAHGLEELALWVGTPFNGEAASAGNGTMVALSARTWREVDAFHAAALAAGGTCDGAPAIRPHYNPDFYVCYVRDPDGNKLAVVCRGHTQRDGQPD
jgi:catechol 2,3-dioxygenase-like lactoylglutathione lyase family enzyme